MNGLLEILTNKHWMIRPDFVHGIRDTFQHNLNGHIAFEKPAHVASMKYFPATNITMGYEDDEEDDARQGQVNGNFVAMYYVDGPVTRNGGACSYGSRDLRDMMMDAAAKEECLGHVFYINTPGGSAWAINDFRQAIDFAHERGQKVIAYIDGQCCSVGMYLAAVCDERYYMNPKDEIGCIGVLAAFYTEKDGSYNQYTNETYHELYDPESFDKNKWYRDIANDDNDKVLIEELAALGVEFRAAVKAACPNATDEHLHGKTFAAEDVNGILMDGQKTLQEVFNRVVELSEYSPNNNNMTQNNYQTIAQMMDVEELVVTEEGTHLDVSLLDRLQEGIEVLQAEAGKVDGLTQQLADAQKAFTEAQETHAQEVAALNETINAQQETINANTEAANAQLETITNLNTELEGARAAVETAQQTIAERDQQIADLNAQIAEMQNSAGNEPDAGESPASNGEGAAVSQIVTNAYVYDPSLSYEENMRRKKEHDQNKK